MAYLGGLIMVDPREVSQSPSKGGTRHVTSSLTLLKRQWLVDERVATFWTSVLAVFLTLATARGFPFVKRLFIIFWPRAAPQAAGDPEHRHDTIE
jgi:hypothetical protein